MSPAALEESQTTRVEPVLRWLQSKIGGETVRGVQTDREVLGCVKMCERSPRLGVILHVKMVASNLNIFVENRAREDR